MIERRMENKKGGIQLNHDDEADLNDHINFTSQNEVKERRNDREENDLNHMR